MNTNQYLKAKELTALPMLLLRSVTITDPASPHHKKVCDIRIESGKIREVGKSLQPGKARVVNGKGAHLSPGWLDTYATLCDPGYEHREDLQTGCEAAARGGFTAVVCTPDTNPPVHSKSEVSYIREKMANHVVDVLPMGTITYDKKGTDITEMYDMHEAGAIAFTDGDRPVSNAGVLLRALQYVKPFGGLVMNLPQDQGLASDGVMNEGKVSTRLGLKGIPHLAETLMLQRDLELAEYARSRIHFPLISAGESISLLRQARKQKIQATAGVSAYQLAFDDQTLETYDTNYKVCPPLRTSKDVSALQKGLQSGVIDVICSGHLPQAQEAKKVEFDQAGYGMISLETCFALTHTALKGKLPLEQLIEKLAINPRKLLGLPVPVIEAGATANCTLFDPEQKWEVRAEETASRSRNTPLLGQQLKGKVLGVINGNRQKLFVS